MNKDTFFNIPHDVRVTEINNMLQTMKLKEVSEQLDIAYSTFLKEMTAGDYVYVQRENRYFKFIREDSIPQTLSHSDFTEELLFIRENLNYFKTMLVTESDLIISKKVHSKDAAFSNRSIKMNDEIYADFSNYCHEKFPQFRLQDLIAQSLLDFIEKY
ncbi:hypothetical protein BSK62_22040 [Paenibacillus odorifer]|uniref:hypothetical protein n=1 Tax=Paenibacillus odorifer TaxID=189426 RepID=UPI00096BF226|nr:hypothetical protein [Paenibacillus odorifer]OMD62991.1 hypothetical protein BSK62_22040 [Paenibacillus odorifer]